MYQKFINQHLDELCQIKGRHKVSQIDRPLPIECVGSERHAIKDIFDVLGGSSLKILLCHGDHSTTFCTTHLDGI